MIRYHVTTSGIVVISDMLPSLILSSNLAISRPSIMHNTHFSYPAVFFFMLQCHCLALCEISKRLGNCHCIRLSVSQQLPFEYSRSYLNINGAKSRLRMASHWLILIENLKTFPMFLTALAHQNRAVYVYESMLHWPWERFWQITTAITVGGIVHSIHDDVIKWKHFPRYWPFVREFTGLLWIPRT